MFGHAFEQAVWVTQLLFLGTVVHSVTAVLGGGLLSAGKPVSRSAVMIGGAALTVPLLLWWVPLWGARGAALASLCTYALMSVATLMLFSRHARIPIAECLMPTREDLAAITSAIFRRRSRTIDHGHGGLAVEGDPDLSTQRKDARETLASE
jgi:O-antigen/teichoic acid export membrane protein